MLQRGKQSGKAHEMRIEYLRRGYNQFGHAGRHQGSGRPDCPRELHHHHDVFCEYPTEAELVEAGIDPEEFKARSRR